MTLRNKDIIFLKYFFNTHNYNMPFCHESICKCNELKDELKIRRSKNDLY